MVDFFPTAVTLPSNAQLTFEVNGDATQVDQATGNVTFEKTEVVLNAALTELGDKTRENDQVGQDTRFRNMRGYILDNIPLGVDVTKGRVKCIISNQSGTFHFTERVTPFVNEIKALAGTPIQGSFQTEGGGN